MIDGQRTDATSGMVPAGEFSAWLTDFEGALRGEADSDVPCNGCTACCTASQFIHIAPSEADTLAHIPRGLLFAAPGRPRGHVLLGYDERGHCPMLVDDRCSIYAHRPQTCRTYDCRVFPATGVEVDDGETKRGVAERAARWTFVHPADADRIDHEACVAAAAYLADHRAELPDGAVPTNPTQLAVLALEVHREFLGGSELSINAVSVAVLRRGENAR